MTQRITSDALLPPLFLEAYAQVTLSLPCRQEVAAALEGMNGPNVAPFLGLLGPVRPGAEQGVDPELRLRARAARAAGLTTERELAICAVILDAVDVEGAWLGLQKIRVDREALSVVIRIAMGEADFNPFYGKLLLLAEGSVLKHAFKGIFGGAENRSVRMNRIVGLLAASVALEHELGLSVWRGTRLRSLGVQGQLVGKVFFREIFATGSEERCAWLFEHVGDCPSFRLDLRVFVGEVIRPFLLKNGDANVMRRLEKALALLGTAKGVAMP